MFVFSCWVILEEDHMENLVEFQNLDGANWSWKDRFSREEMNFLFLAVMGSLEIFNFFRYFD